MERAPILLVKNNDIEDEILDYISMAENVIIVGGEKSISKALADKIAKNVGTTDTIVDELSDVHFILNFPGFKESLGWYSDFFITKDGKVTGKYIENLPEKVNTTDFTGNFDLVWKIDDYTYQLEYNNHTIVSETGTCVEVDYGPICYVEETPGFTEGNIYNLYLPGAEYAYLPEEVRNIYNLSEGDVLDRYCLFNVTSGEVFIHTTE